jgi:hypothetical protein
LGEVSAATFNLSWLNGGPIRMEKNTMSLLDRLDRAVKTNERFDHLSLQAFIDAASEANQLCAISLDESDIIYLLPKQLAHRFKQPH